MKLSDRVDFRLRLLDDEGLQFLMVSVRSDRGLETDEGV